MKVVKKNQQVSDWDFDKILKAVNKSVVAKVIAGKNKKTDHGVYFADLTLEGAL